MKAVAAYCRSRWEPQDGPSSVRSEVQQVHRYAMRQGLTIQHLYTVNASLKFVENQRFEIHG